MHTDRASLIELGVLPDSAGAWPLAPLFDRTHGRAGHEALKKLLAAPLGTPDAIAARQALLPALGRALHAVEWRELSALSADVERGLSSNYVLVPGSRAEILAFAVSHRDIVTFAAILAERVHALLQVMRPLADRLQELHGDAAFNDLRDTMAVAIADPRGRVVSEAVLAGGTWRRARVDTMLRGSGDADQAPYRAQLRAIVAAVAQLDAWYVLATANAQLGGTRPLIGPRDGALELEALRHPLLPQGVANTVVLRDAERVCFLTGPNMAGKSTVLRAMGLAVYFAHMGLAVPALRATVPLVDALMVSIAVHDDLSRRESLYLAEVRRVKRVVEAVTRGEAVFGILDEVFRGTNIKDATEATGLLVDGLACARVGRFVIASHLAEVGTARLGSPGVACRYMETQVDAAGYAFTYRIAEGVSDVHLGMRLLDAEGVGGMLRALLRDN